MVNTATTYISGWASYHPEGRVTNDEIVERFATTHEWLDTKIGVRERRIAAPDQSVADLLQISAEAAIDRSGVDATDIDLILSSTSYDDMSVPSAASRLGDRVGPDAYAFDVKAACTGWILGLDVATTFLESGRSSLALVTAAELNRHGIDPSNRDGVVYFGDASVASVVQLERPERGIEVVAFSRTADNSLHDTVEVPWGGQFRTDARRTKVWVEAAIAKLADEMLSAHDLTTGDLRALVCHQANLRLVESLAAELGVDEDRHWHNVGWAGNTAAAGAASALFEGIDANIDDLRDGDLILVVTVGAGLNGMAVLLRWISEGG